MLSHIFSKITVGIVACAISIAGFFGIVPENKQNQNLGATIPQIAALFETSLAAKITDSANSMTLVSGTTKDGTTLSGTYGFIIDEGTASEEFVLASCTDTACSSMTRGISTITGNTEVSALKFEHRRGASVKITDHPVLAILSRILNGQETLPNTLQYNATSTFTTSTALVDKNYVDATLDSKVNVSIIDTDGTLAADSDDRIPSQKAVKTFAFPNSSVDTDSDLLADSDSKVPSQKAIKAYVDGGILAGGANSSSSTKGISKLSVDPASPTNPIAVGDNDTRIPTQGENDALAGGGIFGTPSTSNKFLTESYTGKLISLGGTGVDGALSITTGTTTIDLGAAAVVVKNYTSISITGDGKLAFTNPNASGTFIILKSQGAVTLTSSASPLIDASGMGAAAGTNGAGIFDTTLHYGGQTSVMTGGVALSNTLFYSKSVSSLYRKSINLACGSGGGNGDTSRHGGGGAGSYYAAGGAGGDSAAGSNGGGNSAGGGGAGPNYATETGGTPGAGGRGGGVLVIESAGDLNFTGAISVAGKNGGNWDGVKNNTGAGGGGAGGMAFILYNTATSTAGTINTAGGNGGSSYDRSGGNGGSSDNSLVASTSEF